jgi:hypothetical protein
VLSGLYRSVSDDIGVDLVELSMLSEAVIPAFVPRLGENKGMLPVRLKLTGVGGLPGSADIQVSSLTGTIGFRTCLNSK